MKGKYTIDIVCPVCSHLRLLHYAFRGIFSIESCKYHVTPTSEKPAYCLCMYYDNTISEEYSIYD